MIDGAEVEQIEQFENALVDTSDGSIQTSHLTSNMNNSSMNESLTTCSDDTGSSGSRRSRADISFPSDLLLKKLRRGKNQSLERKEKKRQTNKFRLKRQASLVDIVAEEDKAETEKITQKRRVLPHLKLIFDDGEKSEDSEILQQIQRLRCSSVDKLPKVIEEENDPFQAQIFEGDDESGDDGASGSSGVTANSGVKIGGFFNVSSLIDKHEFLADIAPIASLQSVSKKHQNSSTKKSIYLDDVIKEEDYIAVINEEREDNAKLTHAAISQLGYGSGLVSVSQQQSVSQSSMSVQTSGSGSFASNCGVLLTGNASGENNTVGNSMLSSCGSSGNPPTAVGLIRSLSASSLFSSTQNSPRYRLKVDEVDEFDEINKKAVANAKKQAAVFTPADHNAVIFEEVEKENDQLNDLLQKVRNQIEKQESFLKKIAMQTDEIEGEMFQSRGDYFEEIKEIENDCEEKNSSAEETPTDGEEDEEEERSTEEKATVL